MNEKSPHKSEHDKEMALVKRYKNLLHQPHRKISHLHLRNNPYPEVHLRSYCECPQM